MMKSLKQFLNVFILFTAVSCSVNSKLKAQDNSELFTIYLVRHAEKDVSGNHGGDPPLTACGEERAKHLSNFLGHIELDAVYSTNYARTQNTAMPTAKAKELEIQDYSPRDLEVFAEQLKEQREDALVAGHSNTTGVLAGLLVGEEIGSFDESIYNRIYQVVFHEKEGRLHLFHTAFYCTE